MSICQKCNKEIPEGYSDCPNCTFVDLGNPVHLTTALNEAEADIIVSKLKSFGIMSMLQYPGFGSIAKVYCGRCNFEVNILVPEKQLDDALAIISDDQIDEELFMQEVNESITEGENPPEIQEKSKNFILKYITFILLIAFLILLIFLKFNS